MDRETVGSTLPLLAVYWAIEENSPDARQKTGTVAMHINTRHCAPAAVGWAILAVGILAVPPSDANALTPNSPEVRRAIDGGIKYLESGAASDPRVGANALVGIALLKRRASPDHPKIVAAVEQIKKELKPEDPTQMDLDIYSTGLSIIFLIELDPTTYQAETECLLKYLQHCQKPHGGWGYPDNETGDTSMTQYGVLGSWEAVQAGFSVPIDSLDAVATWLLRTQDPDGGFGYQGVLGNGQTLVKQNDVSLSMTAAGFGSLNICSTLLGLTPKRVRQRDDKVPLALKEVVTPDANQGTVKRKSHIDAGRVRETRSRAERWLQANYRIDFPGYTHYYLYALERCMSFQEYLEQNRDTEPPWYNEGAQFLIESQSEDGGWQSACGRVPDTAFGVLFLLRSTKKSIERVRSFGDGTLIGGRGLPKNTSAVELRDGHVVPRPLLGPAEKLLAALENPEDQDIDERIEVLAELPSEEVKALSRKYGEKIRRLVSNKSPETRLAVVRALGKTRNLDNVEPLIFALTDPDPVVAREANEALLRISRNSSMVSFPEKPTDEERRLVVEKWKSWYRAIRPNVTLE